MLSWYDMFELYNHTNSSYLTNRSHGCVLFDTLCVCGEGGRGGEEGKRGVGPLKHMIEAFVRQSEVRGC